MPAAYILIGFAVIFVTAALLRLARHGALGSQGRTWLLVSAIFLLVSTWLLFG